MGAVEISDILNFLRQHALLIMLCTLVFMVLNLALTVLVFRDAQNRGMSALLWAFMTLIFSLPAVIIYLIVRVPIESAGDAQCQAPQSLAPTRSPSIGSAAIPGCPQSFAAVSDGDKVFESAMAWLAGLTGPVKGKRYEIKNGESLFGRDTKSSFYVDNPKVSAVHARLVHSGESFTLEDMGSTNGTYLNGHQLPPHEPQILKFNDEIRLGREISFKLIKAPAKP